MIKKIMLLLAVSAMIVCALAASASAVAGGPGIKNSAISAGESILAEEPSAEPTAAPPDDDPTPTPTAPVTPRPSVSPSASPTPTATPTPTPPATPPPTPKPTPTAGPTPTPYHYTTPTPTPYTAPTPTPTPAGPAVISLWNGAADTLLRVNINEHFDIVLLDGISDGVTVTNYYGNLPATVTYQNNSATDRSCSLSGVITAAGSYGLSLEFTVSGGRTLSINFVIIADEPGAIHGGGGFPAAHVMVPFSGSPTAMIPAWGPRTEVFA